ncbi:SET domain-containing protein [Roridomyces roridus]|uniref:SET domain-containing protein n=1 Tax=Roridomyces roridus TaxID=1738132 RepID=A0AAD7BGW3_9AGAR|nr:SET domain-containing protein [Roridomyces roridus]
MLFLLPLVCHFLSFSTLLITLNKATSSDVEAAGVAEFLREEDTQSTSGIGSSPQPNRRQSGPLKQKQTVAPLPHTQTSSHEVVFARPLNIAASMTRMSRREIIQNEWNRLARDAGAARIEFINDVDEEEVPPGIGVLFPYLERKYLFDIGIAEPSPMAGCECDGVAGCSKASKCGCCTERKHAYTDQGLFAFNTDEEITECNTYCSCPPKCINRVAQFPRPLPVQIFKTEERGWGARIPVNLVRGRVVGLYTGLLIRREDADKLSGRRASYCFDLDVNEAPDEDPPENAYSVDAYGCGNWTRFINHSCVPNLKIISVVYDTMPQDNMPYIALVATKTIPAYTELTFDYNPSHQIEFEAKRYKEKSKSIMKQSKTRTRCLCGAAQCRKWLSVVA